MGNDLMAHFVELDTDNNVLRTIVISNDDILDDNGNESESIGVALAQRLTGSTNRWIQASYNGTLRRQFPNRPGFTYQETLDVFIEPAPFASWSLDDQGFWQPPTPRPTDETHWYYWDEDATTWTVGGIIPTANQTDGTTPVEVLGD